jgi:hypothetical protein
MGVELSLGLVVCAAAFPQTIAQTAAMPTYSVMSFIVWAFLENISCSKPDFDLN